MTASVGQVRTRVVDQQTVVRANRPIRVTYKFGVVEKQKLRGLQLPNRK